MFRLREWSGLRPRPKSWTLDWPKLISTSSMTCWCVGKFWSCGMTAMGSPWLGKQQDSWKVFEWGFTDDVPEALNQTNDTSQWKFTGGADWTTGYTAWHMAAPKATRMSEERLGRWGRWRTELAFVLVLFLINLVGFSGGLLQVWGADMERLGGKLDWGV